MRAAGPRNTRQSESDGVTLCGGLAAAAGRGSVSPSKQTRNGTGIRQRAEDYLSVAVGVRAAARRLVHLRRRGAASVLRPGHSGSRCWQPAQEFLLYPSRAARDFFNSSGGVGHQRSSNGYRRSAAVAARSKTIPWSNCPTALGGRRVRIPNRNSGPGLSSLFKKLLLLKLVRTIS